MITRILGGLHGGAGSGWCGCVAGYRYRGRVVSDPLVPKTLLRMRRNDPEASRLAEHALDELLSEGGLADLSQHDLQTYLWFTLAEAAEPLATAQALGMFFELAELNRYAAIAMSSHTRDVLRIYEERGHGVGAKAASKAMDSSGVVPPDLPELEWGEVMGPIEVDAYNRIATTLELALAAGDLKPGGRGWRSTQQRLTRQQLTMPRPDGPVLLERVRGERLDSWAEMGGHGRRGLASAVLSDLLTDHAPPRDVADRMAPMQWLLELAEGRLGDAPGVPLTVSGNLARRVVQEAGERFGWWDFPDRPPRSESDIWQLAELRTLLQRTGALRRSARRLVLGTRGRAMLRDASAQWSAAMVHLIDPAEFEAAVQESALMLLLQAHGMVEMRDLIREVAEVMANSGWRDTGNGAPPQEHDVGRAVWALVRRCQLWSLVEEGKGPGFSSRVRLSDVGRVGGFSALRSMALRPRMEPD
jgi:hypothetical protein